MAFNHGSNHQGGTMVTPQQDPPSADPDNVPETLCIGKFNVSITGPLATLTFTHARPKTGSLIDNNVVAPIGIVRARIVISTDNLLALRDLITRLMDRTATDPQPPASSAGGGAKLN